jgi:hypothetical protein
MFLDNIGTWPRRLGRNFELKKNVALHNVLGMWYA